MYEQYVLGVREVGAQCTEAARSRKEKDSGMGNCNNSENPSFQNRVITRGRSDKHLSRPASLVLRPSKAEITVIDSAGEFTEQIEVAS